MEIYNHFHTSVEKALSEIEPKWRELPGVIICGTHTPENPEFLINKIAEAKEKKLPFLGVCFGHQLAAIQWARESGTKDATSEEFGEGTFVVKKLPKLNVGLKDGESYWNNYEVVIDWEKPENFFTTQSHPEYQSSKDKPHPLLVEFLDYAKFHLHRSHENG